MRRRRKGGVGNITFIKALIDIVDNESAIDAVRLFERRTGNGVDRN